MRRWLLGIFILLLVGVPASPFIFGLITKHQLTGMIARMPTSPKAKVELKSYHLGWLSSTAEIVIQTTQEAKPATTTDNSDVNKSASPKTVTLQFVSQIKHGPLFKVDGQWYWGRAAVDSALIMTPELQQNIEKLFSALNQKPEFKQKSIIDFMGNVNFSFSVSPFGMSDIKAGEQVQWQGLGVSGKISQDLADQSIAVDFKGLKIDAKDFQLAVDPVQLTDHRQLENGILKSMNEAFKMPQLTVRGSSFPPFLLSKLEMLFAAQLNSEKTLISSNTELSLGLLQAMNKQYGPCSLSLALNNFGAEALKKLSDLVGQKDFSGETDEQQQAALAHLVQLFNKGFELKLAKFECTTPEGLLQINGSWVLPKEGSTSVATAGDVNLMKSIGDLMQLATDSKAELNVRVPVNMYTHLCSLLHNDKEAGTGSEKSIESLITDATKEDASADASETDHDGNKPADEQAQCDEQMAEWLKSGLVVQEGGFYIAKITYDQKQLLVNNKAMEH